ncbi:MAG: glycosyltransferase [Acidimicrobiales bacterium]
MIGPAARSLAGSHTGRIRGPGLPDGPTFSVVVPVYRPAVWLVHRCVASVRDQTWPHWELCLCDDGSGDPELARYLHQVERSDRRVRLATHGRNLGIATATNTALGLATGDFVALLDHDDELLPGALASMAAAIEADPRADVLYSDEDKLDEAGLAFGPRFKPDWSPDYLLTTPYLGHLLVVRRRLLDSLDGMRAEMDGSQDYDLMLRATERARAVVHVPEVLYHWRIVSGSAAGDSSAKPWAYAATGLALRSALDRRGEAAELQPGPMPGMWHVRRDLAPGTTVSVVVSATGGARRLRRCLDGLGHEAGVGPLEVLVVPPVPADLETTALLRHLADRPGVRLAPAAPPAGGREGAAGGAVQATAPGGGSGTRRAAGAGCADSPCVATLDAAARLARGQLVLFLDARVDPSPGTWLRAMAEHAQRHEVGPVGARLVSADGRLLHAGLVLGLGGQPAAPVLEGLAAGDYGYLEAARVTRNWSAVSGACLMVRRDLLDDLGGLDDAMGQWADVDLCLRAGRAGYRSLVTPLAELVADLPRTWPTEAGPSRCEGDAAGATRAFLEQWSETTRDGDPYFSPNLSRLHPGCLLPEEDDDARWNELISTLAPSWPS